jgi:flagellar hook assembly protein FlgD
VVRIDQTSIPGDTWQGTITTASGEAVRKWNWQGNVEGITWDGKDESGALVGDGTFYYELKSSDSSGNSFSSGKLPIAVETEKKAVRLSLDQRAFSPNGDGLRDTLALGATVQFPERVKSYELVIVAQEGAFAMNAVRTWKGSGSVPTKFTWAGETDSGIPAPDGRYAASLAVVYANGDSVDASTPVFIIDRVFPKIQTALSQEIFSPNGDGRSDTVEIKQTSMPGDDWTGKIFASDGSVVKTLSWKSEAKSFIWDGRDDTGGLVRDGTYRYVAEASDVAGNRSVSTPLSVTVDTEKKTVRIDADTLAFSPNGDGVRDSVNFGVAAQSRDKILKWSLEILPMNAASASLPVKTWSGPGTISERFTWDGGTDSGLAAPDGRYVAKLVILYANDDRFEREAGPILLDRVPPQATVRASASIFSPNGDGRSDTVQIFQESVPGDDWQGLMIATGNRIVRAWTWKNKVESFIWDGKDGSGIVVADGSYEYELRSVDAADNSFISPRIKLVIDASKKNVRFEVDQKAFSPNGDGIKDKLFLNIQAPRTEAIKEFEAAIFSVNASGVRNQNAVRTWRGDKNLQDQYAWDGTTDSGIAAPDGNYQATLKIVYENDDLFNLSSGLILLDTVAPRISLSAEPLLFSPNGDGNRDEIRFRQSSSAGDDWTGRVKNAAGTTIKTWTWRNEAKDFIWDGKDSSGTVVRDGIYSYEVGAVDQAGNAASARIANIQVDAAKPKVYVTASDSGMSPNGDGIRDEVSFTIVVERREGIESWRFSLMDKQGVEKSFFGGSDSEVPARLVWDGRDLQGQVVQGEYTGKLVVRYAKGDIAQAASTPVLVDVDPPKVDITVTPEYFSPDGDGASDVLSFDIAVDNNSGIIDWKLEVFETAIVESSSPGAVGSERLFMEWSGKGKPLQRITWDGKSSRGELVESATDYPFKFVARDALGNTTTVSGFIAVDVLVIRDGDRLKIKVPSIVFRANYPDFVGLSADIIARNEKVVARIAQILNKFPDYRIRIEGHANNIGKMLGYTTARIQAEETRELIPLSTGRAELVRTMLVQNGVDARRLSVQGLGSSEPVVSFTDVENRWKNRRVEFVLIKNQ